MRDRGLRFGKGLVEFAGIICIQFKVPAFAANPGVNVRADGLFKHYRSGISVNSNRETLFRSCRAHFVDHERSPDNRTRSALRAFIHGWHWNELLRRLPFHFHSRPLFEQKQRGRIVEIGVPVFDRHVIDLFNRLQPRQFDP